MSGRSLLGDAADVLIVAPAGCGKTYSAAATAASFLNLLPEAKRILILAHTNAAIQEFRRRTRDFGGRVVIRTLDSLALELVSPYASALGLETPLSSNVGPGRSISFEQIGEQARYLVENSPTISMLLAHRYPVIILDEHQDARDSQDAIVRAIARSGDVCIRCYADPMQAIYEHTSGDSVNVTRLRQSADHVEELSTPHRWCDNPSLGEWIMETRDALINGRKIGSTPLPACVRIISMDLPDVGFGSGNPVAFSRQWHKVRLVSTETTVVLSALNRLVKTLYTSLQGRFVYNEGADFDHIYDLVDNASTVVEPRALAMLALDFLQVTSSGLTKQKRQALERVLTESSIRRSRSDDVNRFGMLFAPLYSDPSVASLCETLGAIYAAKPVKIFRTAGYNILGRLRPGRTDAALAVDAAIQERKRLGRMPRHSVSTIHKAKGLAFDHVIVANFGASHFPDTEYARKLAYVAISRARGRLTILAPANAESPLLSVNQSTR